MTIPMAPVDARQATTPLPTPTPGYMPGMPWMPPSVPGAMGPAPVSLNGVAPFGMGMPLGVPPTPFTPFGMGMPPAPIAPFGVSPFGMPPAPIAPFGFGVPPTPIPPYGVAPFGMGMPLGVPPAPIPGTVPPYGVAPFGMGAPLGALPAPIPGLVPPPAPILGLVPPPAPIPGTIPPPSPVGTAATFLLGQIALKEAAVRLGDEALKARVIAHADEAINRAIEDLAGVTLHPWMRAWAQTWVYPAVADLALLAHVYQEGSVRAHLLDLAGQLLSKGLAPIGEGPTNGKHK